MRAFLPGAGEAPRTLRRDGSPDVTAHESPCDHQPVSERAGAEPGHLQPPATRSAAAARGGPRDRPGRVAALGVWLVPARSVRRRLEPDPHDLSVLFLHPP